MSDMVKLEAWPDPVVEACGFPVRSPYLEFCWTWVVGPTGVLLLRWASTMLAVGNGHIDVDLAELAPMLGVGTGTGNHSVIRRTLGRLEFFRFAAARSDGWALRQHVAPLPMKRLQKAPAAVQWLHWQLMQERHPSRRAG